MTRYEKDGVLIEAGKIEIGSGVKFGKNIKVNVKETFRIGDYSRLGDGANIEGRNVIIGSHLYNSSGLSIGQNRFTYEDANFSIGDRCTIHNNKIDLARQVIIGNDVGLSPDVVIYTHGYWGSVLNGYPAKFRPVTIEDNVIIGFRSVILGGAYISSNVVVGAQSVVSKTLHSGYIYAGSPAKIINGIKTPSEENRQEMLLNIIEDYKASLKYRNIKADLKVEYPFVTINSCSFDVLTLEYKGDEDEVTDDFREFIFKYGIRFYSPRGFPRLNFQGD